VTGTSYYVDDRTGTRYNTAGGVGVRRTIQGDGTETVDHSESMPYSGTTPAGTLVMTFRGVAPYKLSAHNGTETLSPQADTLTFTVTIAGRAVQNTHVIAAGSAGTYTCQANTSAEQNNDGTSTVWARG
jgi:hypothetical protein